VFTGKDTEYLYIYLYTY